MQPSRVANSMDVLLKKLIVAQPVNELPPLMEPANLLVFL
jgi:hypothetical protein